MHQHAVFDRVLASMGSPLDVVVVPPRHRGDLLLRKSLFRCRGALTIPPLLRAAGVLASGRGSDLGRASRRFVLGRQSHLVPKPFQALDQIAPQPRLSSRGHHTQLGRDWSFLDLGQATYDLVRIVATRARSGQLHPCAIESRPQRISRSPTSSRMGIFAREVRTRYPFVTDSHPDRRAHGEHH